MDEKELLEQSNNVEDVVQDIIKSDELDADSILEAFSKGVEDGMKSINENNPSIDSANTNNNYTQQQYYQQAQTQQQYYQQPYMQQQMQNPDGPTNLLSMGDWVKYLLLLCIPFANIVLLIIWAVGGQSINQNLRNFARAQLIVGAIMFCVALLLECCWMFLFAAILSSAF